jgi:hypothetical protein
MAGRIASTFALAAIVLLSCSTQARKAAVTSGAPAVDYTLERIGNEVWHINHDSEYYDHFNKVQQTYDLLINETKDPREVRRLYIERDLKIAQERLKYMADPKLVKSVIGGTESSMGANSSGHVFRKSDIFSVPRQYFTPSDPAKYVYKEIEPTFGYKTTDALTAIIQFDRQLKKRGVDLIVVPVPNSSQVYAHRLDAGIKLEDAVWHPWSHMIVKLLEYDVEALDLLDLFKAYSGDNTVLNYIDHHWGKAGLDIVSEEIGQRFQRYLFDAKYYLDPSQLKTTPILVNMPNMIPYWDHVDEAYIRSKMHVDSQYPTVRITYKGNNIMPAASFEDSPVLLMGDSFIFHLADTSSGIYAHLALNTRIIPAQFSANAGAAKPPSWYKKNVAGKGKEPKVVIWIIYGSAFEEVNQQNDWSVTSIPDPVNAAVAASPAKPTAVAGIDAAVQPLRKLEWVAGEVVQVTKLPKLDALAYPDALYSYKVKVTDRLSSSLHNGEEVVVYGQFMADQKLLKKNVVKQGEKKYFYLEEWMSAANKTDKLGTMQLIDDLGDFDSAVYFSHYLDAKQGTELKKLVKTALTKGTGASPEQSLAFDLKDLRLLESMKLMLRRDGSGPVSFTIQTSIDGSDWFSMYQCSGGGGDDAEVFMLPSAQPARFVRFTSPTVKTDIVFDNALNNGKDFSGVELYGY